MSKTPRCLSAAISCGFRPPRPAHRDGNGLRCPEVGNAGRFDAKRRSVVPVRWVAWPNPRRLCDGWASSLWCAATASRARAPAGASAVDESCPDVPRGTWVSDSGESPFCPGTGDPRTSVPIVASAADDLGPNVPRGTSSGAEPSLSHPAAWPSIAASRALRMRAPISGGNRPCRTTVPSSSCQNVRPRFSCWASARSVSSARFARRWSGRTSRHAALCRAVRC